MKGLQGAGGGHYFSQRRRGEGRAAPACLAAAQKEGNEVASTVFVRDSHCFKIKTRVFFFLHLGRSYFDMKDKSSYSNLGV